MRRGARLLAAFAVLVSAVAASGSESSERLYSRGLLDFHAGRYREALSHFEGAVAADPDNALALYYRGVARSRLRDFPGAISDLKAALERRPDLSDAALELGVALIESGRHEEAIEWLERAQSSKDLDPQASLFLGVAQLRTGRNDAAEESLRRAAEGNPELQVSSNYYRGIAAYQDGDWSAAEVYFALVVEANPDSEMGREATEFLAAARARKGERYQLFGAVGLEYDSNVRLSPDNDVIKGVEPQGTIPPGDNADGRLTINAGGSFVPWRNDDVLLSVGYEFFQSLHFHLGEFNLQDHRPGAQIIARAGNLRFGLAGRYDYYMLQDQNFLQEGTGLPWVTIMEERVGRLELFYRVRRRDFLNDDFRIRDGTNHAPGLRQVVELGDPDRYFAFGYRFDRDDPKHSDVDSESFGYDGHEVGAEIGWLFPADVRALATYAFRRELYNSQSERPASVVLPRLPQRQDSEHLIVVVASKQLTEHVKATCAYYGDINDSNQEVLFQYDRHIGSVGLEVAF